MIVSKLYAKKYENSRMRTFYQNLIKYRETRAGIDGRRMGRAKGKKPEDGLCFSFERTETAGGEGRWGRGMANTFPDQARKIIFFLCLLNEDNISTAERNFEFD